jgi:1-aminocyclopropane-1-carboxylate deaminase/D-cysteine desulfhydrase-like pyridoxal-dependent ACC family enzyme
MVQRVFKTHQKYSKTGCKVFVKRDDLISLDEHASGPQLYSGNKFRKLFFLLSDMKAELGEPESATGSPVFEQPQEIHSFGGNQSNMMAAVAKVANMRNIPFIYHTTSLPRWLKQSPTANLKAALELGMTLLEFDKPSFSNHVSKTFRYGDYECSS